MKSQLTLSPVLIMENVLKQNNNHLLASLTAGNSFS